MSEPIPGEKAFYNPTLRAIHNLGGSAANDQVYDEVIRIMQFSDEQLNVPHKRSISMVVNRIQWALYKLKNVGLLESPRRAYYALTEKGKTTKTVNPHDLQRLANANIKKRKLSESLRSSSHENTLLRQDTQPESVPPSTDSWEGVLDDSDAIDEPAPPRRKRRPKRQHAVDLGETSIQPNAPLISLDDLIQSHSDWREEMLVALRQLPPERFERFLLIILQASGLHQIEVMRSDDSVCEGMAVTGGGLMSQTRVSFRCERASPQLVSEDVVNFRRDVNTARAVKGMFIALGQFTNVATAEAQRLANPPLELIHGDMLVNTLKEMGLGLKSEIVRVERVVVDSQYFDEL